MISEVIQDYLGDIKHDVQQCISIDKNVLFRAIDAERVRLTKIYLKEEKHSSCVHYSPEYNITEEYDFPYPLNTTTFYSRHCLRGDHLKKVQTAGWSFEYDEHQIVNFWLDLENPDHADSFADFLHRVIKNLSDIKKAW